MKLWYWPKDDDELLITGDIFGKRFWVFQNNLTFFNEDPPSILGWIYIGVFD